MQPFDNAKLTKLFGFKTFQNTVTTTLNMKSAKTYRNGEMAVVTWFDVCSLNFPMLDSGLCCQVDFRNLAIEHESTPFKTAEIISVGSPFLEARSTSSILQSFGPAVVSNNCSFSGQNIVTILTYKKTITLQQEHIIGCFARKLQLWRYGIFDQHFNQALKSRKLIFQSAPCTCMECQFTPKTALGCCNLGDFSM